MRLYTDLDNVLINPVMGGPFLEDVVRIEKRPDAEWFIEKLSRRGELWLLTSSMEVHARRALRVLGPVARRFSGVITREDLSFVEAQIRVVMDARVAEEERAELWSLVRPIAPRGPVFDDFPVGSDMFILKSTAVGIGPEGWIEVEPFTTERPDRGGLRRAYAEFRARFGNGTRMAGRRGVLV